MRKFLAGVAVVALAIAPQPAGAMDFSVKDFPRGKYTVLFMSGDIQRQDGDKLVRFLMETDIGDKPVEIWLNSNGGDVSGAVQIAQLLQNARVLVPKRCLSACFILFAAAKEKLATMAARVGTHAATATEDITENRGIIADAGTLMVAKLLRHLNVPDDIIMNSLMTQPESIYQLTPDELKRMGAELIPSWPASTEPRK
jgi:hypothetical protein